MEYYYLICTTNNEYSSSYKRICKTYEEAVSLVSDFADWFCDNGCCDIVKVDSNFNRIKTYVFWKGSLVKVY